MNYDRRTAAIDPSILGITPGELAEMDEDEQTEALFDALNRAADLSGEIAKAFPALSASDRQEILHAAKTLSQVARRNRPG